MSAYDKTAGKKLLEQQPELAEDGLYANPRLRYLQTMLNRLGFSAGVEDGLPVLAGGVSKEQFAAAGEALGGGVSTRSELVSAGELCDGL